MPRCDVPGGAQQIALWYRGADVLLCDPSGSCFYGFRIPVTNLIRSFVSHSLDPYLRRAHLIPTFFNDFWSLLWGSVFSPSPELHEAAGGQGLHLCCSPGMLRTQHSAWLCGFVE